jgi:hypothetical protein
MRAATAALSSSSVSAGGAAGAVLDMGVFTSLDTLSLLLDSIKWHFIVPYLVTAKPTHDEPCGHGPRKED